eukprot:SAG31_NODE_1526_length_8004_cov_4.741176_2_plen_167_part_00
MYNERGKPGYVGFNMTYVAELCSDPTNGYDLETVPGEVQVKWSAYRLEQWCNACYDGITKEVFDYTSNDVFVDNLQAMLWSDWLAFIMCAALVALTVVGEMKDIELCETALRRPGISLQGWRRGLLVLPFLRKWTFLPALQLTVPSLILTEGGVLSRAHLQFRILV